MNQRGFTLMEAMIGFFLISAGSLGALYIMGGTMRASENLLRHHHAVLAASVLAADIVALHEKRKQGERQAGGYSFRWQAQEAAWGKEEDPDFFAPQLWRVDLYDATSQQKIHTFYTQKP